MSRIWRYGDNVNTDVIFPGKYIQQIMSMEEMGQHALENLDTEFNLSASKGDIIVAGKNWGCGSSREQAARCLKARGVRAVVARSFARIFFRNAINEGLVVIACPALADSIDRGTVETLDIELSCGRISIDGEIFQFDPYPKYIIDIINSGGLIEYVRHTVADRR